MNYIKTASITSYYLLPVTLVILVFTIADYDYFILFGQGAEYLLYTTLFIKPLTTLTGLGIFKKLLLLRRQLGVAIFWLYLFHASGMVYLNQLFARQYFTDVSSNLFWGSLAGMTIFILGITSNDYAQRLLRHNWKKIQQLSYLALYLVLIHISIGKGDYLKFYLIGGSYLLLKILAQRKIKLKTPQSSPQV